MITTDIFTDFFHHFRFMPTHSVVINLKKSVRKSFAIERVDTIVAEKTYHAYHRSLSKRCYPYHHYRRYKSEIPAIAACELSSSNRPHLHILMKKPDHLCETTFCKCLYETAENNHYIAPTRFAVHITNLTTLPKEDQQNIINYNMKDIYKTDRMFIM